MIIGTQIVVLGSGAKEYLTPWFPAMADNGYVTYEKIYKEFNGSSGTASYTVNVWTKNREDIGSKGTEVTGSFAKIGSVDFYELPCEGLRDLVRFKITITPHTTPAAGDGVALRFLPVTWYSTAT